MRTKKITYVVNRNGWFYFTRRVPCDLLSHYTSIRIVHSLNTSCPSRAKVLAAGSASKLDRYWASLRLQLDDLPGQSLLRIQNSGSSSVVNSNTHKASQPLLSEALKLYVSLKGKGRSKTFQISAQRACGYVIQVAGDKRLGDYERQDALKLRDWLVHRGLAGSSVTRNFSYVKAVYNFAASENALNINNPFSGVYFDRNAGVKRRKPIPNDQLHRIQLECQKLDDDIRWLVALLSDSGMRLAEAAGLTIEDIHLNCETPFIQLKKHPWRSLKTASSERKVPLAGHSLWAAQRIMCNHGGHLHAFPRYNARDTTSANSASAALNKWLKDFVDKGCTIHSFRHSFRDRLRAVSCPGDIIDQLGGWRTAGVGQGYGEGYPVNVMADWVQKIAD